MDNTDPILTYPHVLLRDKERYVVLVDAEDQEWLCTCARFYPRTRPRGLVYAGTTWLRGNARANGHKHRFMHRLIWERYHGPIAKGRQIDHINGNGLDNRKVNLRLTDAQGNAANRRANIDKTTSCYKGVSLSSSKRVRYRATVITDGTKHCLGTFANERDAAITYNLKARELFGEFSLPNDVAMTPEDESRVRVLMSNPKWAEDTASRHVGVLRYRDGKRWYASICVNRHRIYLGIYDTEDDAAKVYNAAAVQHWGDKAKLNVIQPPPSTSP